MRGSVPVAALPAVVTAGRLGPTGADATAGVLAEDDAATLGVAAGAAAGATEGDDAVADCGLELVPDCGAAAWALLVEADEDVAVGCVPPPEVVGAAAPDPDEDGELEALPVPLWVVVPEDPEAMLVGAAVGEVVATGCTARLPDDPTGTDGVPPPEEAGAAPLVTGAVVAWVEPVPEPPENVVVGWVLPLVTTGEAVVPEPDEPDVVDEPVVEPLEPLVGLHDPTACPAHGPLVQVIGTTKVLPVVDAELVVAAAAGWPASNR